MEGLSPQLSAVWEEDGEDKDDSDVRDEDILMVASNAADSWLKIARRLPDMAQPGKVAFSLDDNGLDKIARDRGDDEERLIAVLQHWRRMSHTHTSSPLFHTLNKCGFGKLASTVMRERKMSKFCQVSTPGYQIWFTLMPLFFAGTNFCEFFASWSK